MELAKVASTSFVLIDADWPAGRARALIEQILPSHVIVRRNGQPDTYYLFKTGQAQSRLRQTAEPAAVHQAFDWSKVTPAPLIDGQEEEYSAPAHCVVHDEGRIIGFYDGGQPVAFEAAARDFTASSDEGSGPSAGQSLTAEFPEKIKLEETASLLVSLVRDFIPGASLAVALSQGSEIDIVVQPRRGFALEGPAEGKLVVTGDEEGLPLQFKLRSTAPGPGQVRVLAFHLGRPLGMITLAPSVVESAGGVGSASQTRDQALAPATVRVPDLSLLILESKDQGETVLGLRLTSADPSLGYNLKPFGPIRLRSDPYAYFQALFKDIESLPIRSVADKAKVELRLAAKGASLFEQLVPEDLKGILWKLRARVTSVQVQSDEPWIPWELCKLVGKSSDSDEIEDGPFFCEAFQLTRWMPGLAQITQLGMKKLALVVPNDSGLPFAAAERDSILSLASGGRSVESIPATFLDVQAALASGAYDAWHFSGHGAFRNEPNPERSAMILQGGDKLTPEDLSGRVANLGKLHPLIFLNACQIGQSAMGLTGMGGWASRFLKAGAGGFLGAYWSIYDQPAFDFAKAFYARLFAGDPVGKAARQARLAVKGAGDPTWLAYTVFADPMATVA